MPDIIGIDASRAVRAHRSGTENYSVEIISALRKVATDAHLRLYYPDSGDADLLPPASELTEHVKLPGGRLWTHRRLASELRRQPPAVVFVPAHVIPVQHPRAVVTVHDLGYIRHPADHPRQQRIMLSLTTRWNIHQARHIIVPSQFSADDLERRFPGAADKVTVVHHGVSERFRPAPPRDIERVKASAEIDGDYVFAVGTIQPRKDYPTLATAIARHNDLYPTASLSLVIAGRPGWMVDQVMAEIEPLRLRTNLKILSEAQDEDLVCLYSGATAVVQPSRFEGFGMPVLEAMACGTPVICANSSSLPEVAGAAGLTFPTGDVAALTSLLGKLRTEPALRSRLSALGLRRASLFDWETSAKRTFDAIDLTMKHG